MTAEEVVALVRVKNKLRKLGDERAQLHADQAANEKRIAAAAAEARMLGFPKREIADLANVSRPTLDKMLR